MTGLMYEKGPQDEEEEKEGTMYVFFIFLNR